MPNKNQAREKIDDVPAKILKPEQQESKTKKNKLINVLNYLTDKYEFRYNLFAAKPEFRAKISNNGFVIFNERNFDNIFNEVKIDLGVSLPRNDLESLIGSNKLSEDYEPIKDFIFKLPKWDGKDRFTDFLKQIQLEEDEHYRPWLVRYFTRWFVAMVASLIDDYIINELALVFVGKQGRGKTRFFNSLVPKELRLMYLYNGSFNPHDKDMKEMLGTKILINLDEMATLTRTDIETLKSAMSERYVVLRRAYGRAPIHLYRRASFCGSHNDLKFLTDQTGNRRWLPFLIHDIDVDEEFDIKLLYAQALEMWRNKSVKIWLDKQEIDDLEIYLEQFRRVPMEEELVLANYRQPDIEELATGSGVEYYQTSELLHKLASQDEYKKMNVNDTSLNRLGKALKALGFVKVSKRFPGLKNPKEVWAVKKIVWRDVEDIHPASGDKELF